jgi:hypothetical protein
MKQFTLTLSIAFLALIGFMSFQDSATTPDPNAPVIEFESDVVDYGTIKKNSDPIRIIKFKNTGKTPLVITNCKGSCGCTVPECPKEPIQPGETGELKVRYATDRVGPINKTVTVKSNASNGTVYIKVKGKVLDEPAEDAFPANGDGPATE